MLIVSERLVSCQSVPRFKLLGYADVGLNPENLNGRNFSKHHGHRVQYIVIDWTSRDTFHHESR